MSSSILPDGDDHHEKQQQQLYSPSFASSSSSSAAAGGQLKVVASRAGTESALKRKRGNTAGVLGAAGTAPAQLPIIRVIQIDTPLLVHTDVANFRATVQSLTGRNELSPAAAARLVNTSTFPPLLAQLQVAEPDPPAAPPPPIPVMPPDQHQLSQAYATKAHVTLTTSFSNHSSVMAVPSNNLVNQSNNSRYILSANRGSLKAAHPEISVLEIDKYGRHHQGTSTCSLQQQLQESTLYHPNSQHYCSGWRSTEDRDCRAHASRDNIDGTPVHGQHDLAAVTATDHQYVGFNMSRGAGAGTPRSSMMPVIRPMTSSTSTTFNEGDIVAGLISGEPLPDLAMLPPLQLDDDDSNDMITDQISGSRNSINHLPAGNGSSNVHHHNHSSFRF